jgi:urease accessory protein
MLRAAAILPAATWDRAREIGTIRADAESRFRRRMRYTASNGLEFLLDLPRPQRLADGDGLELENGAVVRVIAEAEALLEITAFDDHALTRIAWHLGNRHIPVQFLRHRLRIRAEATAADLIERLGGDAAEIEAAFDPEPGAYVHG